MLKNAAWMLVAGLLLAIVVLSRDWSYAKQAVGALDAPQAEIHS